MEAFDDNSKKKSDVSPPTWKLFSMIFDLIFITFRFVSYSNTKKVTDVVENPEKALQTQISHKINGICSAKYYASYFDLKKRPLEANKKDGATSQVSSGSKKKLERTNSSEASSQEHSKKNKTEDSKTTQQKVLI